MSTRTEHWLHVFFMFIHLQLNWFVLSLGLRGPQFFVHTCRTVKIIKMVLCFQFGFSLKTLCSLVDSCPYSTIIYWQTVGIEIFKVFYFRFMCLISCSHSSRRNPRIFLWYSWKGPQFGLNFRSLQQQIIS